MAAVDMENAVVSVPTIESLDESYSDHFLGRVHDLWKSESLADVYLQVEGRTFACHRLVLVASCPYFASMFTGGFSEAKQQTVSLQEIDAGCMEEILKYAYSGTVQVSRTNARELYLASDLLQVEHVRDTCLQFMVNQVDSSTCMIAYQFAQAYGITELLQAAKAFICSKFSQLSQTEEFLDLPLSDLKDILSSPDLDIEDELVVLQAVERWIKYNPEERMSLLEDAASVIRFNLIQPSKVPELFTHVQAVEEIRETGLCMKGSTQGRLGMDAKELYVFFGGADPIDPYKGRRRGQMAIGAYDPETRIMYQLSNPGTECPSAIIVDIEQSILYVVYMSHLLRRFVMFDSVNNRWIEKAPPLYEHRVPCDLAHVNSKIYLLGDISSDENKMECFDPTLNQWTVVRSFPESLGSYFFTASIGEYIYVVSSKYFYRYNVSTDHWFKLSKITTRMYINDAWAHGGKLYCVNESMTRMCAYSPGTGTWNQQDMLELPEAASGQLVSYQGKLRAVIVPRNTDRTTDRIQIHSLSEGPGEAAHWDHEARCLPPVCFEHQRFLCLNARLFPSRLSPGHEMLRTESDDDGNSVYSFSDTSDDSADWDDHQYWDINDLL
ncbi:PREDICTED: kelch repeat and BTB domain-containing protein 6-like [Branchiostoma belcheri]|uniref:Kelch repeat and BTB domain-containing protein 6-like n=1 Tax=Branchiostoma belcheri TaxID=7741 RepID=A0A6P5A7Z5_BRABE|nr:PREDICTED: kelch repeat and BTB domain-containing protein 6-like [Branchiostoma belcheri]